MAKIDIGKKDLVWLYVSRFLTISINILFLPLVIRFLSEEELGLWYVFVSISQIINLFDFGFNSTVSRHMTYAWSGAEHLEKTSVSKSYSEDANIDLVSEIIITCRLVYLIISVIALATMATFGTAYIYKVVENGLTTDIMAAWIIYIISVFLNMFYGYWSSLLQGIGAIAERSKMSVYSKASQIVIAMVLIFGGFGLLGFVISYFISGLILRIIGKVYFNRRIKGIVIKQKVELGKIQKCFAAVWGTAWKDGIVMLAQFMSTQANTLICAYYIDLASTSVYGIMTQIVSVIASTAAAYFAAYQPAFSSAYLRRDKNEQKKIVCITDFVYKLIFAIGVISLFTVGIPLIRLIRPGIQIRIGFSVLLCVFYYFFNQKDLFASMIASSNEVPFWPAYVITAICSFFLSAVFVRFFNQGIIGLVIAQLLVNMVYNFWRWPMYIMKRIGIGYFEIYTVGFKYVKSKIEMLLIQFKRGR